MIDSISEFLDFGNFDRAWQKVADNKGCAGVDGETIELFGARATQNLIILRDKVADGTYQPRPYLQVAIPKKSDGYRFLSIPCVRDRIVQQALLNILHPEIDPQLSPTSFAYRPQVSYLQAVEAVAQCREQGYEWVLDADIVKYFDNIDREILLQKLRQYLDHSGILCLIKSWLAMGIATKAGMTFPERGIPQGAVVSPLLANIYLDKFDRDVTASGDLRLVRYGDDFVVMARTQGEIQQVYGLVDRLLKDLNLELHSRKTQITTFDRGFRFLGHGFLGAAIFPVDEVRSKQERAVKKNSAKVISDKEWINQTGSGFDYAQPPRVERSRNPFDCLESPNDSDSEDLATTESDDDDDEIKPETSLQRRTWNREMATLYLLEQGTSLYRDYQRLIVHIPERERLEIPIREIERILIFGRIQLSTPVVNMCLEQKIGVFYLNRSGQYQGHLWSADNLPNELIQFDRHKQPEFQLNICREIVRGKLLNSKRLLQRLNRKRKSTQVGKAIAGINLDLAAVARATNLDSLRGHEGSSAVRYFGALNQLIVNPNFSFNGRNRQPPTDPVNSLLSFGYTLLFNNVLSLILAEGLSPYFGNFHYGEDKKPYLAFDLMEEFRSPIVDGLVLRLLNKPVFKVADFDTVASTGGVYLNQSARKVFLRYFESRLNEETTHPDLQSVVSYRYVIQLQIRRYKRSLLSDLPYEAFMRVV
jgi:CRISP-associated protein Cas1